MIVWSVPVLNTLEQLDKQNVVLSASHGLKVVFRPRITPMLGLITTAAILMDMLQEFGVIPKILTRKKISVMLGSVQTRMQVSC